MLTKADIHERKCWASAALASSMVRPLSPLLVRVALLDRGIRAYDPTALLSSQRRRLLFEGDSSAAPVPPPPTLLMLVLPLPLLLLPPAAAAPIAVDFCPDE
jgi:hypothetical protein